MHTREALARRAGATSTVGLYPLETIRTHLAEGEYRGIVDAARGIIRQEGFGGLYGVSTGCGSSLCGGREPAQPQQGDEIRNLQHGLTK